MRQTRGALPLASLCTAYTEEAAMLSASVSGTVGPCGRVINDTTRWRGGLVVSALDQRSRGHVFESRWPRAVA